MDKKTYYRPASLPYWWLKTRFATLCRNRTPLEEVIRVAIAWDMPYAYGEIVSMLRGVQDPAGEDLKRSSPYLYTLAERLFKRSQTVDWVVEVLGVQGLRKWYPVFKSRTREDLREEIERFYYAMHDKERIISSQGAKSSGISRYHRCGREHRKNMSPLCLGIGLKSTPVAAIQD